jgi:N-acetylmuramoyl-L-alanine amidase
LEDKGVKRASLWVLWKTAMPSLLTEIGFLTNKEEEKYLLSDKGQNEIAYGLYLAFKGYKNEMEGVVEPKEIKKPDDKAEDLIIDVPQKEEIAVVEEPVPEPKQESVPIEVPLEVSPDPANPPTIISEMEPVVDVGKDPAVSPVNDAENPKLYHKPKEEVKVPAEKNKEEILFKVQIFTSEKKIPLTSDKFKGLTKVSEYKAGNLFKYCVGHTGNFEEATHIQNEVRKGEYKEAFVVAFKNGERIDVNEAKKLIKIKLQQ